MKYYRDYPYFLVEDMGNIKKPKGVSFYYIHKNVNVELEEIPVIETISNEKTNIVIYKFNDYLKGIDRLIKFHKTHYGEILMKIERKFPENLFFYCNYKEGVFIGSDFISLNEKRKEKVAYTLNKSFELTEYSETFYDNDNKAVLEKHFFPKHWHIDVDEF